MTIGYWIVIAGLICDISGALMLAKAVIVRKSHQIQEEATTRWSQPNWGYIESAVYARTDGWFAGGLLVTGFVIQLVGSLIEGNMLHGTWIAWLSHRVFLVVMLSVGLVAILVLSSWWRRKIWAHELDVLRRLHTHLLELNSNPSLPADTAVLCMLEKRLSVSRQVNEIDRHYLKRAIGLFRQKMGFPKDFV